MSQKNKKQLKTACIGQCMRLKGYCESCGRTEAEIYDWILLTQKEKDAIIGTEVSFEQYNSPNSPKV